MASSPPAEFYSFHLNSELGGGCVASELWGGARTGVMFKILKSQWE